MAVGAVALTLSIGAQTASSQSTAAAAQRAAAHDFDVPAGALAQAAVRFSQQAGVQLLFDAQTGQSITTRAVQGQLPMDRALAQMLDGTGLTWQFLGAGTITIQRAASDAHVLGAVQVEGAAQSDNLAFGPGAGFNGSSDPTATEGTGRFTSSGTSIASRGAPVNPKDTPQSVSVITQEEIQQLNVTDLASALAYMPGITLRAAAPGSLFAMSRGLNITTMMIDGGATLSLIGLAASNPLSGENLSEYDNIQVLRGSDALFGGVGEPGGTINLTRKRPLDHAQFAGTVKIGSWDDYNVEADATGPIAFNDHLRARLVVDYANSDYFYQSSHRDEKFIYEVQEADLGADTLLRFGGNYHDMDISAPNSYGLPRGLDGSDLRLPVATNFAPTWNYSRLKAWEGFVSLEHRFSEEWHATANFTHTDKKEPQLVSTTTGYIVPGGGGVFPFQNAATTSADFRTLEDSADITLDGKFSMLGLEQGVKVGVEYSSRTAKGPDTISSVLVLIPDIYHFDPSVLAAVPEPQYTIYDQETQTESQWSAYFRGDLQPIAGLHFQGGVRVSKDRFASTTDLNAPLFGITQQSGLSVSYPIEVVPYASVIYAVSPEINVYASYSDLYQSNSGYTALSGGLLPATTGSTYETGVKGSFKGGKLNPSLSVYRTLESNVALTDLNAPFPAPPGCCYFDSGKKSGYGVDAELAGEILPGWQAQASYNYAITRLSDSFSVLGLGSPGVVTQQPMHQLKTWTSYTAPGGVLKDWTFGGGVRFQTRRSTRDLICSVAYDLQGSCPSQEYNPFNYSQPAYSVLDLRVAYQLQKHWNASLSLTNVADTRYYTTAAGPNYGNFYGEPRAFMISINGKY